MGGCFSTKKEVAPINEQWQKSVPLNRKVIESSKMSSPIQTETSLNALLNRPSKEFVLSIKKNQIKIKIPTYFLKVFDETTIEPLGAGGFGCVFSIKRFKDSRFFAVKRLTYSNEENVFSNITKEINILYRLNAYGNIINFEESYSDMANKAIFIAMEKADTNLTMFIENHPKGLPYKIFKILFTDLLFGLTYSYRESVVHSDIKPDNILVFNSALRSQTPNVYQDPDFEKLIFKLTDFGAGTLKVSNDLTSFRDHMAYTINYAAPEILMQKDNENQNIENDKEDVLLVSFEKADVYSLAMTLLLCCGIKKTEINPINKFQIREKHDKEVKEILEKIGIENPEYVNVIPILENMLKFNLSERFSLQSTIESFLSFEIPKGIIQKNNRSKKTKGASKEFEDIHFHIPSEDIAIITKYSFEEAKIALKNKSKELSVIPLSLKTTNTKSKPENPHPNNAHLIEKPEKMEEASQTSQCKIEEEIQTITMKYINSLEIYHGEYLEGFRHGKGIQIDADGRIYEGNFRRDFYSDHGKMMFPNGSFFYGYWWSGLMDKGILIQKNKTIYLGEFNSDEKNGQGIELMNDNSAFEGEFKKGKKHGKGILRKTNGEFVSVEYSEDKIVAEGELKNGFIYYIFTN